MSLRQKAQKVFKGKGFRGGVGVSGAVFQGGKQRPCGVIWGVFTLQANHGEKRERRKGIGKKGKYATM